MAKTKKQPLDPKTRVLIVEDHDLVRRGLAALIDGDPELEVCGHAVDVDSALRLLKTAKPTLMIIDLSLKNSNGLELIKKVRAKDDNILMLVSSMHDESLYAERVLRAGGSGYVHKQEVSEKVLDAIHTVLDGGVYFSPEMKQRVLLQVGESSDGEVPPDLTLLSNRELEVFQLIGRGRQTREIADSLNLSVKTIETYRGNIKAKLKLDTSTDLICRAVRWAVEQGLQ